MSAMPGTPPTRMLVVNDDAALTLQFLRKGLVAACGKDHVSIAYVQTKDGKITFSPIVQASVVPLIHYSIVDALSAMIEENFPSDEVVGEGNPGQITVWSDTDEVEVRHQVGRANGKESEGAAITYEQVIIARAPVAQITRNCERPRG